MTRYVKQVSEGYPATPYADPQSAALALQNGRAIRWEPGSGSGYDLLVVARPGDQSWLVTPSNDREAAGHKWLLDVTSPGKTYCMALHETWTVRDWARSRTVPHGSWADLKPILHVFGAASPPRLHQFEVIAEIEARERYNDGRPLDTKDAELGRRFRRLMERELAHELRRTHTEDEEET